MPRRKRPEYWAAEKNSQKLAETCYEKITTFFDAARTSYHFARAARSWCYYHGLYFEDWAFSDWTAVREISDDVLAVDINHFRNLLEHIYTIVCQQRLAFQPRVSKPGAEPLQNAKKARGIIEDYRRGKGLEETIKRAVRHCLVLTEGYVHYPWDRFSGDYEALPAIGKDGELRLDDDGEFVLERSPQGDYSFSTPSIFDVVYDPGVREWQRNHWILVRTLENKYELAAQAESPSLAQEIVDQQTSQAEDRVTLLDVALFNAFEGDSNSSDVIGVWNFYHEDTLACPGGRMFRFVGEGTPLADPEELPFQHKPISRVLPGETLLTQLGYSPANDLQGLQELLNSEMSTIATNHAGAGFSWVWKPPGSTLSEDDLGDGIFFIEGGQSPPVGGSFQANSPDHERFGNTLRKDMETISGVNSVARGQPDTNLKSGEALKVMDAKANLSVSSLKESYAMMCEEIGTFIVRHTSIFMREDEERFFTLFDDKESPLVQTYGQKDFDGVDGIIVDIANPILDTVSGKMWMADQLLQRGMITNPWEFLTLIRTGDFEKTVRAEEEQLKRVHSENDKLVKGETVYVSEYTDNHVLDIREHSPIISSPENRGNAQLVQKVGAHIAQHVQALMKPDVQYWMAVQGFPTAPPLPGPMGAQMPPMQGPAPGPGNGGSRPPPNLQGGGEQPMAGPGGPQKRMPKAQSNVS